MRPLTPNETGILILALLLAVFVIGTITDKIEKYFDIVPRKYDGED